MNNTLIPRLLLPVIIVFYLQPLLLLLLLLCCLITSVTIVAIRFLVSYYSSLIDITPMTYGVAIVITYHNVITTIFSSYYHRRMFVLLDSS